MAGKYHAYIYKNENLFYFNFNPTNDYKIYIKKPETSRKGHITVKMQESTRQQKQKYYKLLLKSYIMRSYY